MTISARLLGTPQCDINGAPPPAELLWRKHLAVCLLLWLAPDKRRTRDQLLATLWADKPERAARHSLNEALRIIRRAAGDDAIESIGEQVYWRAPLTLDLDTFARLAGSDPVAAARLIGGELCDGFSVPDAPAFDDWLAAERRDWQARLIAVLSQAAQMHDEAGDSHSALGCGALALRLDPYSDLAARAEIRSRWLLGDRGGAIAAGQGFRERLAAAVGATPDQATLALLSDIGRTQRAVLAPPIVSTRRPPLIGRHDALAELMAVWRGVVAENESALAIIEGDPGSGRTRMLEEILSRTALEGATTILIRAVDADADAGEEGLLDLLDGALLELPGVGAAPPAVLASLAARRTDWAERYPGTSKVTGLPLNDAIGTLLREVATERPLVLAIDDVDRLGASSRRAIPALLRRIGNAPALLVLSLPRSDTDDLADALRRSAGREGRGAVVRLPEWTTEDLVELLRHRQPEWAPDAQDRLARRLGVESGGLPAIAIELLDGVSHGLSLDPEARPWPARDQTMDQTLPVPMPVALVAALRMAFRRLDPESQQLLTTAALLQEPFPPDTLARLCPTLAIGELLDRLEWQCWVVADARGYAFRARAIRRMIGDEMLTPGQRRRLIQQIEAS